MKTDIPKNFKNRTKCKIRSNPCTRSHANKITVKITINLVSILDNNCALRKLEMASWRTKISNFSGVECPQTPLVTCPFSARMKKKLIS